MTYSTGGPVSGGTDSSARRPRRRRRRWLIIALAAVAALVLVVVGVGAWYYLSFYFKVSAANSRVDSNIKQALETPPATTLVTVPPSPTKNDPSDAGQDKLDAVMNLLIFGTDARPGVVESPGSTDVIMLLHIDTRLDYLSILSITRDLWVHIPGYGDDRINAAYFRGGAAMMIGTLKSTFGIDVNKYLGVDFLTFPGLIDRLGGVYVDVDRAYTYGPFWDIDLAAGYQRLDGDDAFLYTRYRFDENADFGRMARQQRVLAGLRDQARGLGKTFKLPGMVNTIMDTATTNLGANEMLKLGHWLVNLSGSRIKQIIVQGPGKMIDGKAVVVVDRPTLVDAVTDFLTPPGGRPVQAVDKTALDPRASADEAATIGPLLATEGESAVRAALATPAIRDAKIWRTAQQTVPFPLEAPTVLPDGFAYADKAPRDDGAYELKAGDGTVPAVRMIYRYRKSDSYLGISATTWLGAPLAGSGSTVTSDGTTYTVVGTLGKPAHVWWVRNGVLYWVSNTLMFTLSRQDLLEIAQGMRPIDGPAGQ